MARIDPQQLEHARCLYIDGLKAEEVAERIGKTGRTVRNWVRAYGWERFSSPAAKLEAAINAILEKTDQSEQDLRRLDTYSRNLAKLYKGQEKQRERTDRERNKGAARPEFFAYQQRFLDDPALFRMVRKARQIGYTYLIAWEALKSAMDRGRDQGFMSASFRQTHQINKYVKQHARDFFGLKLRGSEVIQLPNGAEINFFSSNPATAQGFSGDMYFDEFCWLMRARECFENAAAISTLGDYRITITSTPSVMSHFGEELWDATRNDLDISRHEVTIIDAVEGGNHLIDLGKIRKIFPPRAIRRLFMCETLDDEGAAFTFDEVMACVRDEPELFERQPDDLIRGGLDISRRRDDTSVVFLAEEERREKPLFTWRDVIRFNRVSLTAQTERIKGLLYDWKPASFHIDASTIGEHMADALEDDFDCIEPVRFNASNKAAMVINVQDLVREKRLRLPFDQRLIDSFLAVKMKSLGTMVGYETDGNEEIGHGDDFWALALAAKDAGAGSDDFFMV